MISLKRANLYLLGVYFPGLEVFKDPIPPFILKPSIIYSDKWEGRLPPGSFICRSSGGTALDSREGLFDFYIQQGIKISATNRKILIESEDFDEVVKVAWINRKFDRVQVEELKSIYDLYRGLFGGFSKSVRIYLSIKRNYMVILSSLLTMQMKTLVEDNVGISVGYANVLRRNKSYNGRFSEAILCFFKGDKSEIAFMEFLRKCSSDGGK